MLCGTTPVPPKTTEPVAAPDAVGRNTTFWVQFAPGVKVIGIAPQEPPAAPVNGPVKAMEATVIETEPVFASVTLCAALIIPTPLLVKIRVGSAAVRNRWLSLS